jgi:hypothetical protein
LGDLEEVRPFLIYRRPLSLLKATNIDCLNFNRYCALRMSDPDPLRRLRTISVADLRRFMHWYLDKHNTKKLDAFYVRMRYWRMMYARKMYEKMDFIMAAEMKSVCSRHFFGPFLQLKLIIL